MSTISSGTRLLKIGLMCAISPSCRRVRARLSMLEAYRGPVVIEDWA